ncbi:hypothetical protein WJU16_24020 [Chitinophaga pollutisoli]|uniref:Integral membrane protein n=1 Tax=Chitinophaga pollutisoli TaxID=3133966 RepID=A0ABZ2YND8_9BACT
MNTTAYLVYGCITGLITFRVGWIFFRNGRAFILHLLQGNATLTDAINRILLTGYYLLNLGYAALMIRNWERVDNWTGLLASVSEMTGRIVLTLAIIHYCNMAGIYFFSKKHHPIPHS